MKTLSSADELRRIKYIIIERQKDAWKQSCTSCLWLKCMDKLKCMDLLKILRFIKAEWTRNWDQHLHGVPKMQAYFLIDGHPLYGKSVYTCVYLLPNQHSGVGETIPCCSHKFQIQNTCNWQDCYWAGFSSDLAIKKVWGQVWKQGVVYWVGLNSETHSLVCIL